MKYVNAPVMKKDAMALVTGKPVACAKSGIGQLLVNH